MHIKFTVHHLEVVIYTRIDRLTLSSMLLYCEKADNKEDIFISSLFSKIVILSEKYLSMKNLFPPLLLFCASVFSSKTLTGS